MPIEPHNWERLYVAGWEITSKQKVSGSTASSCLKGRQLSSISLPMHVTLSSESPRRWHLDSSLQVSPREKNNCCLQTWWNNSLLRFCKTQKDFWLPQEDVVKSWIHFQKGESDWQCKGIPKRIQSDLCLEVLQFMKYFRHMILLNPHHNSIFLPF